MEEQLVHIAFLTNDQQTVLKGLLHNLLALQIKLSLTRCAKGESEVEQANILMMHLDHFHEMIHTFYTAKKNSEGNTFYFDKIAIKGLMTAMDTFNRKDTVLRESEQEFVSKNFKKLRDLLEQSYGFEYTLDEIRKAGRGE